MHTYRRAGLSDLVDAQVLGATSTDAEAWEMAYALGIAIPKTSWHVRRVASDLSFCFSREFATSRMSMKISGKCIQRLVDEQLNRGVGLSDDDVRTAWAMVRAEDEARFPGRYLQPSETLGTMSERTDAWNADELLNEDVEALRVLAERGAQMIASRGDVMIPPAELECPERSSWEWGFTGGMSPWLSGGSIDYLVRGIEAGVPFICDLKSRKAPRGATGAVSAKNSVQMLGYVILALLHEVRIGGVLIADCRTGEYAWVTCHALYRDHRSKVMAMAGIMGLRRCEIADVMDRLADMAEEFPVEPEVRGQ